MNRSVVRSASEVTRRVPQEASIEVEAQEMLDEWVLGKQPDQPAFVLNLDALQSHVADFEAGVNADVLYAVKCNPHPKLVQAVYDAGIHRFDTASLTEIRLVEGVSHTAECYFHHPIKSRRAILEAATHHNVRHFTIDCQAELDKISDVVTADSIALHIRIMTPQEGVACGFNDKFGATATEAVDLLRTAAARGFQTGVSFHVGSQCHDPKLFVRALDLVSEVVQVAAVDIGWINCGGGFPVATSPRVAVPQISDFFQALSTRLPGLRRMTGARILVEPGRAIVADAVTLIVQIHQRRDRKLYLNDGIYGALSKGCCGCGRKFSVRLIGYHSAPNTEVSIFGPTCDVTDKLPEPWLLPNDAAEGDWIAVSVMGAYAGSLATQFNGFHAHRMVSVIA